MVVQLMKYGADPSLIDGEGCSCIHLAAQFGHTSIVAYLIAKGQVKNDSGVFFFFPFLFFLQPYLWHMEVPQLRVESELQLQASVAAMVTLCLRRICDL